MILLFTTVIFLDIIQYIIFADVILSWLTLFGLRLRPQFIANIIDPLYLNTRKFIPTKIGMIDFTPIVIIILIAFIKGGLFIIFPDLQAEILSLLN